MEIEPVTSTTYDRGYGEVKEYKHLDKLRIESNGMVCELPARSDGAFVHTEGYQLTVDADIFFGDPDITVETDSDDVDEYGYEQWNFESFAALGAWLEKNAMLVQKDV